MTDLNVNAFGSTQRFNQVPPDQTSVFQLNAPQTVARVLGPDVGAFKKLEFGQRAYVSFGQMVATGSTQLMNNLVDDTGTRKAIGYNFDNIPKGTTSEGLLNLIRTDPKIRDEILGRNGQTGVMGDLNKAMHDYTHFAQTGTARGEFQRVNLPPEQTALGQAAKSIFGVANERTMTATFMALSQVEPRAADATRGGPGSTHREVASEDPTKYSISHEQIAQGLAAMKENPTSPQAMRIRSFAQQVDTALQTP